jgi:integrase/recombinase XerD
MPWEITPEMFLSEQEVEALLTHCRAAARSAQDKEAAGLDRVVVETLLFSGIRNSELCRLTLGDLVVKKGRAGLRMRGTGEENRTVYIPRSLAGLLQDYVGDIRRSMLPAGAKANDPAQPLFINERGKPYERTGLYRRVTRILTEAGLGDRASVQLLRHTYGFLAYKRTGGNLLFVQRQLGHAHPVITSVYARLVDESYENLAELVCPEPKAGTRAKKPAD